MKQVIYPKWEELPELDLYLDQVLLYVNQINSAALFQNDKGLTAAMVNNYVKHGHIAKPIKKKYSRHQLARLIVITTFKNIFSILEISQTLSALTQEGEIPDLYNSFVTCMNDEEDEKRPEVITLACQTLKLYQQTQQLVLALNKETQHDNKHNETQ